MIDVTNGYMAVMSIFLSSYVCGISVRTSVARRCLKIDRGARLQYRMRSGSGHCGSDKSSDLRFADVKGKIRISSYRLDMYDDRQRIPNVRCEKVMRGAEGEYGDAR